MLKYLIYSQGIGICQYRIKSLGDMPYRRLPNTDSARLKAIKSALSKGQELPPFKLAFTQKTLQAIYSFLPGFEHTISIQKLSYSNQLYKSNDYQVCLRKARLFISHFIQVMNMAVVRGEIPSSTRTFYGIDVKDKNLPSLLTEKDVIHWGRKIIDGESARLLKGFAPITNPTIAVVKVWYEKFLDAYHSQKIILQRNRNNQEKIKMMRKQADQLIQNIWNEVEDYFSDLPDDIRREKCMEYGIVYFYRKNELKSLTRFLAEKTSTGNFLS